MLKKFFKSDYSQEGESPIWLTVYSDMMTNLMLFFLMLFGLTQVGPDAMRKLGKEFKESIMEAASGIENESDIDMSESIKEFEGRHPGDVEIKEDAAAVRIILSAPILFDSGKASDKDAKPRPLSSDDFKGILSDRKPSVSPRVISTYKEWSEAFKAL